MMDNVKIFTASTIFFALTATIFASISFANNDGPTCDLTASALPSFGSLNQGQPSSVLTSSVNLVADMQTVVKIYGNDWTGLDTSHTMPVGQTKYQNDWVSGDPTNPLLLTPGETLFTSSVNEQHSVGFQVAIPDPQPADTYSQTITFDFTCGEFLP